MTDEVSLSSVARRLRVPRGAGLGGFIYGTILVLSVLVAAARAYPHEAGHIAALVAVTSFVFWLAHVYAHGLSYSVTHDAHLSLAELRRIAGREGSIVGAALLPIAALLLGAFGLLSTRAAVWAAFGVGLAALEIRGGKAGCEVPPRCPSLGCKGRSRRPERLRKGGGGGAYIVTAATRSAVAAIPATKPDASRR
jgi:hypothetical protein